MREVPIDRLVGQFVGKVLLETCLDSDVSRPRVRPVDAFDPKTRVEFPRKLREMFPIGTRFFATVKVCQKHLADGMSKGPPYLKAYDIAVVRESVADAGLMAKVRSGSVSGLAYEYVWKTRS